MIITHGLTFHPVIVCPDGFELLDFTRARSSGEQVTRPYTVGRYNEKRVGLYTQELFGGERDVHMGIDLGAPAGTAVFAFYEGEIYSLADRRAPGDYGPILITRHQIRSTFLYVLHGHLSRNSLELKYPGQRFQTGERLGSVGEQAENGGWPPHIHIQISLLAPSSSDMPGVVSDAEREEALKLYLDPRLVLGPVY